MRTVYIIYLIQSLLWAALEHKYADPMEITSAASWEAAV
jgi:hypothetical protein